MYSTCIEMVKNYSDLIESPSTTVQSREGFSWCKFQCCLGLRSHLHLRLLHLRLLHLRLHLLLHLRQAHLRCCCRQTWGRWGFWPWENCLGICRLGEKRLIEWTNWAESDLLVQAMYCNAAMEVEGKKRWSRILNINLEHTSPLHPVLSQDCRLQQESMINDDTETHVQRKL